MAQLAINVVKDTEIRNLVCAPNSIVLAKQSTTTNAKTGAVTTNVRFIEVCKVEKTDALSIIQSLLRYCIAEFKVCKGLEQDFADTKIKQKKIFSQFLGGKIIYRTNSEGKISNALVSEVPLRQTALNVKDYHTITTCKKENRKAAIYQHSKAIEAQCTFLESIVKVADAIAKEIAETTTKTTKRNGKNTDGATAHIPGVTVPVAAPVAAQA